MMKTHHYFFLSIVLIIFSSLHAQENKTKITLTDNTLVEDVERLGVHFSGDEYYSSVILKQRVAQNFEGTVWRKHILGPGDQPYDDAIVSWNLMADPSWVGATAHMLSGPDQWKEVKVIAVDTIDYEFEGKGVQQTIMVKFDQKVNWPRDYNQAGVLLDKTDLESGQHPWFVKKWVPRGEKWTRISTYDSEFSTPDRTTIVTGDVPEGGHGVAALKFDGRDSAAFVNFRVQFYNAAPYEGDWHVSFWAKKAGGDPELIVQPTVDGTGMGKIALTGEWKKYEGTMTLEKPEEDQNPLFMLQFLVEGGEVLIDDVESHKIGDGTNPTPFRDELVDVFMDVKPGTVRYLRNTHDNVLNWILPRIRNYSRMNFSNEEDRFGAHEFFEFCEYIDANPWSNLPGTILPEDIDIFMEFVGAPADVGYGKLRAELGREKPWTEAFDRIHVQFGNEAITFFGTGYWGPDYWTALIERAKQSPYFEEDKFLFHLNHQGGGKQLLDMHPDFDIFTTNGYHIFGLYKDQLDMAEDIPGLYDFVFASAWHMWMVPDNNNNYPYLEAAREHGKEVSMYEGGNYHTTFSTPGEVPLEQINRMIVGKAGGMSATNTMLLLLKHWGARTQQSFNLSQISFRPGGAFGNIDGSVRVWGGVLNIGDPETRRYRPRFLALKIANYVIGGNLVETVHTGADPTFDVSNRFGAAYGPSRRPEMMTVKDVPRIHSYGFKEGNRRGLVLVSNDPRNAQPVEIAFDGKATGKKATVYWLESEGLEDTNELDWAADEPNVTIEEKELNNFSSGYDIDLPPATIMAIEWEVE